MDILGFSSMLPEFEREALENDAVGEDGYHESATLNKLVEIFNGAVKLVKRANCKSYQFSDNLCITINYINNDTENPDLLVEMLKLVSMLMFEFVKEGYFLRGGIDAGWFLDADDIAVGVPLVVAYRLESELAVYPRVLLSEGFIGILEEYSVEDYAETFTAIRSEKVLIDLPIYLDPTVSTAIEVRNFFLRTISNLDERISYYEHYRALSPKVVPVISILQPYSDEVDTLITQFNRLEPIFPQLAFRLYIGNFDLAIQELNRAKLRQNDFILYDIGTTDLTNPLVKVQRKALDAVHQSSFKIVIRSAINTDIQNVRLSHAEIIPEANNSLLELFNISPYRFPALGDFAGVKKDDITSGGTISPGFIFYSPDENLYYGYKGDTKSLSEFEQTIVPAVLNSDLVKNWVARDSPYIRGNQGYDRLVAINRGFESGKSQAKFKWIAIMHYLHCIKTKIEQEDI